MPENEQEQPPKELPTREQVFYAIRDAFIGLRNANHMLADLLVGHKGAPITEELNHLLTVFNNTTLCAEIVRDKVFHDLGHAMFGECWQGVMDWSEIPDMEKMIEEAKEFMEALLIPDPKARKAGEN